MHPGSCNYGAFLIYPFFFFLLPPPLSCLFGWQDAVFFGRSALTYNEYIVEALINLTSGLPCKGLETCALYHRLENVLDKLFFFLIYIYKVEKIYQKPYNEVKP
ncbi:hypothetical protein AB205_0128170 [Aquarana catesbeiana]|uniref:Uncharacterized protein n=1 Tax=Aquarana catesbeiana TaxID=8400 RepID=A0A2G9RRV6_AQUCT|nr:hypothetical protein AB205_0128170 [Aquarana catesbeiana]